MNDRRFPPKREIAAVGDSHALYTFGYCRNVDVYWLGPRLMHRVARDGLRSLISNEEIGFFGERHMADYQAILLCFGEIDARSHLPGIAERFGRSLEHVALDLVDRFIASLEAQALFPWCKVIIPGVVPPSALYLDQAQIDAQVLIRQVMNDALRRHGDRLGYSYMPPPAVLVGETGALASRFDLDGVHVDYDGALMMACAAAEIAGVEPRFEPREIDILQMTVANRYGVDADFSEKPS